VLVAVLASTSHSSPIIKTSAAEKVLNQPTPLLTDDYCFLPPELGFAGNVTFLEDCPSLDRLVQSQLKQLQ
jgi:hypothetical protein